MVRNIKIAALLTSHNRREVTVKAIAALKAASKNFNINIFLVDDGSTDGTGNAVAALNLNINIIQGGGSLYWNHGMRRAWLEARGCSPDFYLWLNDDLEVTPEAIAELMATYRRAIGIDPKTIVVGKTLDPETGEISYGGYVHEKGVSRLRWKRPGPDTLYCDTFNGNCVLFPASVFEDVGVNSADFRHSLGDIDYGLRAGRAGYKIVECDSAVGFQSRNVQVYSGGRLKFNFVNFQKVFFDPKGVPLVEWWKFCRRHAGPQWPINFVARYLKVFISR